MKTQYLARRGGLLLAALLLLNSVGASAERSPNDRDPWEGMNRGIYSFNTGLDTVLIHPIAKGYNWVLPKPVRKGVSNFFDNLGDVVTVVNDLLQGKFEQALEDTSRVLWNSTIGIGGLFDPASAMGLERHQEDLGQTFGVWFAKDDPGPYLVLPILGPSTVRDGTGLIGDIFTWPVYWLPAKGYVTWGLAGLGYLDTRAELLETEKVLDEASLDRYAFLRDSYFQHRRDQVYDGEVPDDEDEDTFEDEFEPEPESESQPATRKPPLPVTGASIRRP
jgi:phospholipid-binding lipoprotein MlaA